MRRKIFLIILISFFLSTFFKKTVFIADTPTIRKDLSVNSIVASISMDYRNFIAGVTNMKDDANTPLRQVAKGVYAKETKTSSEKEYNLKDITWVSHTYIVNGKEVIINVAQGDEVPSQGMMEQIYK